MATPAQINANRANAQKSTGPRSAEGKSASRFNALKHGIDAASIVIPGEDPADYDALAADYHRDLQPQSPSELFHVDSMLRADWQKRRLLRVEADLFRTVLAETPEDDSGPVLVTIEYRVQPAKRAEFVTAMQAVREMRRRNGAYFWELFHDSADPTHFVECFMDESWVEHLRQHERVSVADREIQQRAKQYMVEGQTTRSQHFLADRDA